MATKVWKGPDQPAGHAAYVFAIKHGMRDTGALTFGHLGSFPDAWGFAQTFADEIGRSRRTFQRYVAQFKILGWLFTKRGRDGEIPPNGEGPLSCGFTHRFVVGRKLVGAAREAACSGARALKLERVLARDEFTHSLARRLGLPRAVRHLGAAATIAWTLTKPPDAAPERPPEKPKQTKRMTLAELDAEIARRPRAVIEVAPGVFTKPRDGPT